MEARVAGRTEFFNRGLTESDPELAKAVVGSGWGLTELRAVGLSLEEIFLQLTAAEKSGKNAAEPAAKGSK